jgi:hypothetical protein
VEWEERGEGKLVVAFRTRVRKAEVGFAQARWRGVLPCSLEREGLMPSDTK